MITGENPVSDDHVQDLAQLLDKLMTEGQPRVVFDMSGVALLDSKGLELLWSTQENFEQCGGQLKLASLNPLCDEILNVTGVAHQFEIFPNVTTAVGSFVT